jgi:hypothetical protein
MGFRFFRQAFRGFAYSGNRNFSFCLALGIRVVWLRWLRRRSSRITTFVATRLDANDTDGLAPPVTERSAAILGNAPDCIVSQAGEMKAASSMRGELVKTCHCQGGPQLLHQLSLFLGPSWHRCQPSLVVVDRVVDLSRLFHLISRAVPNKKCSSSLCRVPPRTPS